MQNKDMLTPIQIAEEMARRETEALVKRVEEHASHFSLSLMIFQGSGYKSERDPYDPDRLISVGDQMKGLRIRITEIAAEIEDIGLLMVPVYLQTLKKDFAFELVRISIERYLRMVCYKVKKQILRNVKRKDARLNRLLEAFDKRLDQAGDKVRKELEIASFELRRKRTAAPKVTAPVRSTTPIPDTSFVKHKGLKVFASAAVREACRCFDAEAYTAAATMAGAATEAVLLDLLLKQSPKQLRKTHEELQKERLSDLINLALKLGLLGNSAARLSHVIREHRDLVHPARALREKTSLSRGKAEISLGILRDICDELSASRSNSIVRNPRRTDCEEIGMTEPRNEFA